MIRKMAALAVSVNSIYMNVANAAVALVKITMRNHSDGKLPASKTRNDNAANPEETLIKCYCSSIIKRSNYKP